MYNILFTGRDSVVRRVTRLRSGWSGDRLQAGTRDFSLLQNAHRDSRGTAAET